MSALRILIPGAAGATGIDAIKLTRAQHPEAYIVATDRNANAAGFHLADAYEVTLPLENSGGLDLAFDLIKRKNINIILPTCRSDTAVYAGAAARLAEVGAIFVGSEAATVALCDDKLAFRRRVADHFPIPSTVEVRAEGPDIFPCFVKPRRGSGGKGAALCRDVLAWRAHVAEYTEEMIAEEYIPGKEYSVDVFSDFGSRPLVAVPRIRLATHDGVATCIAVITDPELEGLALRLCSHLGLMGASCLQFRRNIDGQLFVQEANPRLGGSSIASALAGVDFVHLSIQLGLGLPLTITQARPMHVVRYLTEIGIPSGAGHD